MSNFTTEAFTLLGIGLAIIGLRWYVRISAVGIRGLQPDDYLMVLVVVNADDFLIECHLNDI
jgi:hypothetical protein